MYLQNTTCSLYLPFQLFKANILINRYSFGCENTSIDQGRSYENMNINISDCYFSRSSTYSGYGGTIYVSSGSLSMRVDRSMFYNCVCSSDGGAIWFSSSNSELRMICANRCSCGINSNGHFALLLASQENLVEFISVSFCSHETNGYYSIRLRTGNQKVDNSNSSMNKANRDSGIGIGSPSFTSSYCTFSNNNVSSRICIFFYSNSGTMSYANIVNNNSPINYGVVSVEGTESTKMMYCVFKDNQNTLFCLLAGPLEVSHSYIYHTGGFSTSTSVSSNNNNSLTAFKTYQIPFFNSLHCNADVPHIVNNQVNTIDQKHMRSCQFIYLTLILVSF